MRPTALLGHSLGEYTAACLAGVFSFEEGLRLVAKRGRLIAGLPRGAMLAVALSEEEMMAELVAVEEVELAAVNGTASCTLAGPTKAVKAMRQHLESRGAECRLLSTSHAFHSAMMEPALEPLRQELESIDLRPAEIPYLSNLTGHWTTERDATDPEAWLQHLRRPVRFAEGIDELLAEPERLLLEVGPGQQSRCVGPPPIAGTRKWPSLLLPGPSASSSVGAGSAADRRRWFVAGGGGARLRRSLERGAPTGTVADLLLRTTALLARRIGSWGGGFRVFPG